MGFLKALIIAFLVYILLQMIGRSLLARYFGQAATNIREKEYRKKKKKEGEVSISFQPQMKKRISRDMGEYVDYEEIKE